jgi:hypothetical protein
MRAIYQLPFCVSFVFLLVQALRLSASELVEYVTRDASGRPGPRR